MNETQLEQVIQDWGGDILRFCRITTGNTQDGDELYQDTMLALLEKRERLELVGNVKSYAISISLNLWKNRRRKFARRMRLVPQESLEYLTERGTAPEGEEASPEESFLRQAQIQMVRNLVEDLPEKYRFPVQMFYSADLSIRDIARILKLPENTVKSRLHRGKEIIRKKLEEMEYDG